MGAHEAAWKERCDVAELALGKQVGEAVALRTCIHRLLDEMVPVGFGSSRAEDRKTVVIEAQKLLDSGTAGENEMEIVRSSVGLLAGTPGACEAWITATKRLSAPK